MLLEDDAGPSTLCVDVWRQLGKAIRARANQPEDVSEKTQEQITHEEFGKKRVDGFEGRVDILAAIKNHIDGVVDTDSRSPLVIYGPSGCGKSALIGKAVQDAGNKDVIYRFIGATPESTDLRSLLENLCNEIKLAFGFDLEVPGDIQAFREAFSQFLSVVPDNRRLVIFLDALDQLNTADNAHALNWLPRELPDNVRMIVTALERDDEAGACLRSVQSRIPAQNVILLENLSLSEAGKVFHKWLNTWGRKLPEAQMALVREALGPTPLPLHMRLIFEEAKLWKSYDIVTTPSTDVPGMIYALFDRFSEPSRHGAEIVSKSLGYLCAARHGLAEDEMQGLLSADVDVMKDFRHRSPRSPDVAELPYIIWSRLYNDLEPYLAWRSADNTNLMTFYHGLFRVAAAQTYLHTEAQQLSANASLAMLFNHHQRTGNSWHCASRRCLTEFPHHLWLSGSIKPLYELARNEEFLAAQRRTVPDDPDCPLRTIRHALDAASVSDDPLAAADFTLQHARLREAHRTESPLDALLAPELTPRVALVRAWTLADSLEDTWRVYWLLVLTWKLQQLCRADDARDTISKLTSDPGKVLSDLSPLVHRLWILTQSLDGPDYPDWIVQTLRSKECHADRWRKGIIAGVVVPDMDRRASCSHDYARRVVGMCDRLTQRTDQWDSFTPMLSAAECVGCNAEHAATLIGLGYVQAMNGYNATVAFDAAENLLEFVSFEHEKSPIALALSSIKALAVQQTGTLSDITGMLVRLIKDENNLILALCVVSHAVGLVLGQESVPVIASAHEVAGRLTNMCDRAYALSAIASAEAQVGWFSEKSFDQSIEAARCIDSLDDRARALSAVAAIQAMTGERPNEAIDAALETAEQITEPAQLAIALSSIGMAEYLAGHDPLLEWSSAVKAANSVTSIQNRSDALSVIVMAECFAGRDPCSSFFAASEPAEEIADTSHFAGYLCALAVAQAQAKQDPTTTLAAARNAVQRLQGDRERLDALLDIAEAEVQIGLDPTIGLSSSRILANAVEDRSERALALVGIAARHPDAGNILLDAKEAIQDLAALSDEEVQASKGYWSDPVGDDPRRLENATRVRWHHLEVMKAIDYLRAVAWIEAKHGIDPGATLSDAEGLAKQLVGLDYVDSLTSIAVTDTKIGVRSDGIIERANKAANDIQNVKERAFALFRVAYALARNGQDATNTIAAALALAKSITSDLDRAGFYCRIALLQIEAGYDPREVVSTAIETAHRIPLREGSTGFPKILAMIAAAQVQLGQDPSNTISSAIESVQRIEYTHLRWDAFSEMLDIMLDFDMLVAAVEACKQFTIHKEDALTYLGNRLRNQYKGKLTLAALREFLPAAAQSIDSAYSACTLVAHLYPSHATSIAELMGVSLA
jgi:hypothetical protein